MNKKKKIILKLPIIDNENNNTQFFKSTFENTKKRRNKHIYYTYNNAAMNTLIVGSTGSGKTKSLIIPILEKFIKDGLKGLIIDVKNDFTNDLYKLAKLHNREKDIIEIGSYETAMKINLLGGLNNEEVKELLRELLLFNTRTEKNGEYWNEMSFRVLNDVIDVIFYINRYKKLPLTFYLLYLILTDKNFAKKVFDFFMELPEDVEKNMILSSIKSYSFHVFNFDNDTDEEEIEERNKSWTYQRFVNVLKSFFSGNLLENLNNIKDGDFILDFKELLYKQNKIIVLRFDVLNSYIGNKISKFIRKKLIADIVNYNSNIPEEEREETFIIVDEFQTVISVDDEELFNDNDWFDKSRSFKCYQIIATQSLSSLFSKTYNNYKIHTLINNCRNKFFLANEDVNTNNYFHELSRGIAEVKKELYELKLGEAYYYYFDIEQGQKDLKLVKLNIKTYKKLKNIN